MYWYVNYEYDDNLSSDGKRERRDAAKRGDVGEVKRLIESGVPVNSQDRVRRLSDCTLTSMCIAYYTCIICEIHSIFALCINVLSEKVGIYRIFSPFSFFYFLKFVDALKVCFA